MWPAALMQPDIHLNAALLVFKLFLLIMIVIIVVIKFSNGKENW